jgi:DNA repair exonuclease SbcCD ATPase subunit
MAPSGSAKQPYWTCSKCKYDTNWASKLKCHDCGHGAPYLVVARLAQAAAGGGTPPKPPEGRAAANGGGRKRGNGKGKGSSANADTDKGKSRAEQQLAAEKSKLAAELKQLRGEQQLELKELKKLKGELEQARKGSPAGGGVDESMEEDDDLDDAVAQARERLKELKALPQGLHGILQDGYDSSLAKLQAELSQAQAAKRASNPLGKQLEGAEAFKARMEKKLSDASKALEEKLLAQVEAARLVEVQKQTVREAEDAVTKAGAEVAALAAKFAAERVTAAPGPTGGATGSGGPAQAGALPQAGPPAGFVSLAFAEEMWQEREAAIAKEFEQLKALVHSQDAAGGDGAASTASDLGAVEDLDDTKWSQVDRTKRAAMLRKQKDELALRVRTRLGKVASVRCPFKK